MGSLLFHHLPRAWAQWRPSRHLSRASLPTFSCDRRALNLRHSISPVWSCALLCLAGVSTCPLARARVWRYRVTRDPVPILGPLPHLRTWAKAWCHHATRDLCLCPRASASPEDVGEGVVPPRHPGPPPLSSGLRLTWGHGRRLSAWCLQIVRHTIHSVSLSQFRTH